MVFKHLIKLLKCAFVKRMFFYYFRELGGDWGVVTVIKTGFQSLLSQHPELEIKKREKKYPWVTATLGIWIKDRLQY